MATAVGPRWVKHVVTTRSLRLRFKVVTDEQSADEKWSLSSFGWTSSRAKHVYMIQHAPLDELLEYLQLAPMPDAPPADFDSSK